LRQPEKMWREGVTFIVIGFHSEVALQKIYCEAEKDSEERSPSALFTTQSTRVLAYLSPD
jgi:hypothetical protein